MTAIDNAQTLSAERIELLRELKAAVQAVASDTTLVLHGSVARGTDRAESDINVLILTESPFSWEMDKKIHSAVFALELERDVCFTLTVRSWGQWEAPVSAGSPFYAWVQEEGIEL